MKNKRKRPASFRGITYRIIAFASALWLGCMGLLTWAVASDMYRQLEDQTRQYAAGFTSREQHNGDYPEDLPGTMEVNMISRLGFPYYFLDIEQLLPIVQPQTPTNGMGSDDWIWGKWDLAYGFAPAVIFYDENGGILMQSGNYLTFVYTAEDNWKAENTEVLGRAYVNLDALEGGVDAFDGFLGDFPTGSLGASLFLPLLRLTGYFEGSQFYPTVIDRGDFFGRNGRETDVDRLSQLDARDNLEWENLLTLDTAPARETETIYVWDIGGILCDQDPLTVNGTRFDTLTKLLHADRDSDTGYSRESLLDSVIICRARHEDAYGAFVYAIAVRCWPLQYAAIRLIPVYLISCAAIVLCVFLILRRIRKSLTDPLEGLSAAIAAGTAIAPSAPWAEPYSLEEYFAESRRSQAAANAELQQLRTALDYARNAEENRRQLVSNITHELKTPLAVIHSYAEGLQAGIAEEKREQYLAVILDEAERMDSMVLQMLDLSRLEAGKVRLASDQFSLLKLTQSVADKFAPMLEAKGLDLQYDLAEDFLITADEARIGQVITNLISNALKYTPQNGKIRLKVYMHQRSAHFFIENTSKPLSDEALQKVWDSFYRADFSRTEPGTGLGLTLVKSIIELHQGSCSVRNTAYKTLDAIETGVEFGFSLPLG